MQIYAECNICENWDDLTTWRNIVHICPTCADIVDKIAPYIQGRFKLNNQDTYIQARKQIREKTWQNIPIS